LNGVEVYPLGQIIVVEDEIAGGDLGLGPLLVRELELILCRGQGWAAATAPILGRHGVELEAREATTKTAVVADHVGRVAVLQYRKSLADDARRVLDFLGAEGEVVCKVPVLDLDFRHLTI